MLIYAGRVITRSPGCKGVFSLVKRVVKMEMSFVLKLLSRNISWNVYFIVSNQLLQLCTARTIWSVSVIRSDSVIKFVSVRFGKCTTNVVTKCWPMETRLPCGDQWKADKIGAFWRWSITRCFIESDSVGLIIEYSINFRLNGEHWRAVQFSRNETWNRLVPATTERRIDVCKTL